ncbi:MAG: hypothetical protein PVJ50_03150, partial [Desulfobacterales bacterium]
MQNTLFCPIPAPAPWNAKLIPLGSGSNFNPQNTQCIPACPVKCAVYFSGVVKIFAFLVIEPRLNIKYGFNWAGKIEH